MSYTDTVNRTMSGSWEDADEETKANAARELVTTCATAAAAVTIQPIPFVDAALISPIQILMVQGIGRIHGHTLDRKSIIEILSTFGASLVSQNVMIAAAKFIPFAGWAVSISMAYALTYAIGEVSHAYFVSGRGLSSSELRAIFDETYQRKKKERQKKGSSLKQRLASLREAYEAGALSDEEYERKKEEILRDI